MAQASGAHFTCTQPAHIAPRAYFSGSTEFPSSLSSTLLSNFNNVPQRIPSYPCPTPGQFMVYLLQFCPGRTSTCFGCGNPLKEGQGAAIPEALQWIWLLLKNPMDFVVVSKMQREWIFQGRTVSKISNVYFHCSRACVQQKQPHFVGSTCIIPPEIRPYLIPLHNDHIQMNLHN